MFVRLKKVKSQERIDKMNDEKRKKAIRISIISATVVLMIVGISLLAVSLKKVEETEYGLLYNVWR